MCGIAMYLEFAYHHFSCQSLLLSTSILNDKNTDSLYAKGSNYTQNIKLLLISYNMYILANEYNYNKKIKSTIVIW